MFLANAERSLEGYEVVSNAPFDKTESMLIASAIDMASEIPGAVSSKELRCTRFENMAVQGNANPYVPWEDPQIPYECSCGEIIYADTEHIHPEDENYAELGAPLTPEEQDIDAGR